MGENETIELTSEGGLMGRGAGSVRIEGTRLIVNGQFRRDLSASEAETLAKHAADATEFRGTRSAPDAIRYRLRVRGLTITWSDGDAIPKNLEDLFEALRAVAWPPHSRKT